MQVRRDEGRRRLRVLVAALATVGAAAGGYGLTRSPLLDVDDVRVRGATQTPVDAVVTAGGLHRAPALVDLDLERIAASVERLPWVQRAEVSRHFPNRVEVRVQERTALATVPAGGERWALVDPTGRVLAHTEAVPAELTRVEAPVPAPQPGASVEETTQAALALVDMLPPVLAGRVPVVQVTEAGMIEVLLDGKVPVLFGAPSAMEDKLIALATLVEKADLRGVDRIDVRVPAAPVLTRR